MSGYEIAENMLKWASSGVLKGEIAGLLALGTVGAIGGKLYSADPSLGFATASVGILGGFAYNSYAQFDRTTFATTVLGMLSCAGALYNYDSKQKQGHKAPAVFYLLSVACGALIGTILHDIVQVAWRG